MQISPSPLFAGDLVQNHLHGVGEVTHVLDHDIVIAWPRTIGRYSKAWIWSHPKYFDRLKEQPRAQLNQAAE